MILNNADDIKVGTEQVDKVYVGSTLIWQKSGGGITTRVYKM